MLFAEGIVSIRFEQGVRTAIALAVCWLPAWGWCGRVIHDG
jgi:hypothetical protein